MTTCVAVGQYGYTCYAPAPFAVYWADTGEDARASCAQHLAKNLRALRAATNNGKDVRFKVVFLDKVVQSGTTT